MQQQWQFPTRALHQHFPQQAQPVQAPITLSTTFVRNRDGSYTNEYVYGRSDNPNRRQLEAQLASLEGGAVGVAFGSGMAAIQAVFQSLQAGDHLLVPDDVYYNVRALLDMVYQRWQLQYTVVDMTDLEQVAAAIRPETRLIWAETPSNPLLKLCDLKALAELAHQCGALLVVDNTWPTPVLQQPLALGADIVLHSTTKYFGGHSDVTGGALILKEDNEQAHTIRQIQKYGGAVPSPFDCWLVSRGIQTLYLRVKAQSQTAARLAAYLEQHTSIETVRYPGLLSHPQHLVAHAQMREGYGAMLSVQIKGGQARAQAIAGRLKLFTQATSLGGVESLVEHRRSVEGPHSSTPDNLLRLSIGLEAANDLIADWEQALS
ncbi:MAG: aminotransferase class I/II-fold pyridoxal phosphate-dependent enzyme [Bacteroidetes bacterium]|nr:MAG: aminotransferase class I/II-fold pyridoxal phosphate-dependent enzyme [Bacteroidota bacterium]